MKNKLRIILAVIALWSSGHQVIFAQTNPSNPVTLSLDEMTLLVKKYHPVAIQAGIQVLEAKADLRIARGEFDPTAGYKIAEKTFDGTRYYTYQNRTITIPTWFGISLQGGMEETNGNRVNTAETIGRNSYWGIQIPLGRDLITDKRRTDLQKAKIAREASLTEKRRMLNDLLLEAHLAYWEWWKNARIQEIALESLSIANKRLQFVRESVRIGERPAIDTVEALTQTQQFELNLEKANLALRNSQWELSQYLWKENQTPYLLPDQCKPAPGQFELIANQENNKVLDSFLVAGVNAHPELLLNNFKLNSLSLEKRYRTQQLLPKASFQYNFLDKGFQWTAPKTALFENNFQYGLSLSLPLRLSKERGEVQKVKYAIQALTLEQELKRVKIENKIKATFNEVGNLNTQVKLQERVLVNTQSLLKGEEIRLKAGESSLFLVNARETRFWEAKQKLEEIKAYYLSSIQKLYWSAGLLVR